ncbi:metallophosphoesterase [Candidatus Calescamantes bacterium]|nr:metallophosphoesterase [Candidatus Calescamantes bacterium]
MKTICKKACCFFSIWMLVYFVVSILGTNHLALASDFTFVVLGDNRTHHEVYKSVVEEIVSLGPDIIFNTGDMISTPGNLSQWKIFKELSIPIKKPYYLVVGNHDVNNRESERLFKEMIHFYTPQVNLPEEGVYYSFDYGDSHFVVLDSEIPGEVGEITGRQFEWLENDLSSIQGRINHIFVFIHRPLYPVYGIHVGSCLDMYPTERDRLHDLLVRYNVDAVFAGHLHLFHKGIFNGLTQIITGGGGAELHTTVDKGGFNHFVYVTVRGKDVHYGVRRIYVKEPIYARNVKIRKVKKCPTVVAKKTEKPITVDGDLSEWNNAYPIAFTSENIDIGNPSKGDFGLVAYLLYDSKNLYFAAKVSDDTVSCQYSEEQDTSPDRDFKDNDYIRLYISARWDKKRTFLGKDDYCFIFTPTGPGKKPMMKLCSYGGYNHRNFNLSEIKIASKIAEKKGYTLEVSIPFSSIQYDPSKSLTMGVNIMAGDTDNPSEGRKSSYALNFRGIPDYWASSHSFVPLFLEKNLLTVDTGFEERGRGWKVEKDKGGSNSVVWHEKDVHAGLMCAKMIFSGKGFLWLDSSIEQSRNLKLIPGSVVNIQIYAKWVEGGNKLSVGFNTPYKDGRWGGCKDNLAQLTIPKKPGWHLVSTRVKVPDYDVATKYLQLKIGAHSAFNIDAFSVLLDDISLTLAPANLEEKQYHSYNYQISDFLRKHPDKNLRSWRDLNLGLVDRESNGCTMRKVLVDFGIPKGRIRDINLGNKNWNLDGIDVLVLADGVVKGQDGIWQNTSWIESIQKFVKNGGICWITSQNDKTWSSNWLPDSLQGVRLEHQYGLRCVCRKAPHYVCPWIIKRHHPVFNYPNYLDERDFSFWAPTVDGVPLFTTALSALTIAQGWDVLARYADPRCDEGALILQAPEGEGLYFWTQIFSPQIIWNQPNRRYRQTWEKLLENILTYFVSLKRNEIYSIQSEPEPWSVLAGESLTIKTIVESRLKVKQVSAEVHSPDGQVMKLKLTPVKKGVWNGKFTPRARGEYFVQITVSFSNGAKGYDHFFFKVTKGWTPYRFVEHIHMRDADGWGTQDAGALFGGARYLGYDVILSCCISKRVWERSDQYIANNPACLFIPGEELHFRLYERSGKRSKHFGEDIRAINIPYYMKFGKIYEDEADKKVAEYLEQIHSTGGFTDANSIFWNRRGLKIDATYDFPAMYKFWRKGQRIWTIAPIDCHGIITFITRRKWNIIWLDKPLNISNFMEALKEGRFVATSKIDTVWIDIGRQPMGGTVYAVDRVPIHFYVDAGEPSKGIGIIRWPAGPPKGHPITGHLEPEDKLYYRYNEQAYVIPPEGPRKIQEVKLIKNGSVIKTIRPQTKIVEETIEDYIDGDTFYCVDVHSNDGWAHTNPIFVKQVQGPSGAWLWTKGEIEKIQYDAQTRRWKIILSKGDDIHFSSLGISSVKVDGKENQFHYDSDTNVGKISVSAGRHKIEFFCK